MQRQNMILHDSSRSRPEEAPQAPVVHSLTMPQLLCLLICPCQSLCDIVASRHASVHSCKSMNFFFFFFCTILVLWYIQETIYYSKLVWFTRYYKLTPKQHIKSDKLWLVGHYNVNKIYILYIFFSSFQRKNKYKQHLTLQK